jgi:DnaJ-class molecular chaperone
MTVYTALDCETEIEAEVQDMGAGAGRIACLECEGTGDWTRYHPEPELFGGHVPCPDCKGSGFQLVSI